MTFCDSTMNLSRDQKSEAKPDEGNKFEGEVRLWDQMSLAGVGPPLFKRGYLVIDKVAVNVFLYLRNGITFLRAIKFECIDSAFKQPVGTIVSFKFTETPYPSTSETKELDHIKEVYLRTDTSTVTTFSIILKSKLNEAARSSKNAFGSSQKASASMSRPMNRTILGSNLNIRRQNLGSVLPILGAQNNYAVIPPTKPNETCYIKSADGFDTDRIKSDQNKTLFKKVHEDHIDEIKIHQRERSKPPPKRSVSGVSSRTRNKTKKLFLNDYKAPVRSTSANKSLSDCEMWIDEKEDGELFSTEDISKAKSDSKIDQERMDIDDEGSALNASLLTGLTNIGNTCYMNAVIQALRSLKIFRAACNQVKKLIKQNCHVIEASPEQLLPFYTKYEQLHSTPSSSELKECLDELRLTVMKEEKNEERLVMREQEDAHEFLVKFIDKIGTEMKQALEILDIQSEDPSYSSLTYKLIRKLACEKCKDNRPSDDEGNHFMLHFIGHQSEAPNMLSIASLFRNSLLAEMVSTRCPKCGHASALMTQEFAKLPKYLIFVVKRLVFEPETKSMKKITEPLVLNKFIAIKNCEPSTSSGDKTSPRDSMRRRSSEENSKRRTTRRRESIIHKSGKVGYVDVVVGEKDDVNERIYTPVDEEWRKKACQLLEIDYEPLDEVTNHYAIYNSTIESTDLKFLVDESPAVVGNVQGDGNCLFRCISHVITGGKEDHYRIVREKICDFMERYVKLFAPMQGISEEKFQAHIAEMRQDAEWGTTMELLAIATMFKVLVFTFIGGRWASYRPFFSYENPDAPEKLKLDSLDPNLKTIYLDNLCEAHFSPVICVPKKMLYQLICIVNHYGDTRGGHYTSDVWKNGTWNHCDDSRVKPKDEHEVMADSSENGYIFIYQIL